VQLDHTRTGNLVRGEGVGGEDGPVQQDHVMSESGKQQGGGGARGSGADHDDVMAVAVGRHREVTPHLLVRLGCLTSVGGAGR
jgi:hypothetical protein